jgi:hypothetical protein
MSDVMAQSIYIAKQDIVVQRNLLAGVGTHGMKFVKPDNLMLMMWYEEYQLLGLKLSEAFEEAHELEGLHRSPCTGDIICQTIREEDGEYTHKYFLITSTGYEEFVPRKD